MYKIIKGVIASGGYKLTDIQNKIKKLYILGDLEEGQMDELLAMTQQNASADSERPVTLALIRDLASRVEELEKALASNQGSSEGDTEEKYETWQPWDGISNKYQYDAIVVHPVTGVIYQSKFKGQNVWEPGTVGTEMLWVIYDPAAEEV